ncbi:MAG TPA: transketolase C-terminal domain-containing protein [Bacillota bacterium]|nr:transketolase C-terminal domain-containing protein [Bacillota bacterium]
MILDQFAMDTVEMRRAYCDALIEAARENPRVVAIDCDVSYSMGTGPFYEAYPGRGINCGIMEAHAIGLAAGLSATGMVPFVHTFGTFATRRAYDQLFLSCAYQDLNVKIIGGDAGVTAQANGGTHMPFEDMGILRNIPGFTIIEPCDTVMYRTAVKYMARTYGNFYMRSSRRKTVRIYRDDAEFTIGKANLLREGEDVALLACGIMVYQALLAAEELEKRGISAAVADVHTIKPLDREAVCALAEKCGAVVACENHSMINGLGSAVAEVLAGEIPVPLEQVGVNDRFGEVGTQDYLMAKFALTAQDIVSKAIKCIGRKKR